MRILICATLFVVNYVSFAQRMVSGTVWDENNEGMPGASVVIKNLDLGTITDMNGYFQLSVPEQQKMLLVSAIGYVTQRVAIGSQSDVVIEMSVEVKKLKALTIFGDEVINFSTKANELTPTTYTDVSKEKIQERNLGLDLPILLNFTPSMVTTSDAGAGVGYTGMRIRGSDATRINVTLNGIPINDSESHGVYWVNMPDLSSSLDKIQIQRGVGTSSNGAAAFGATVNLQSSGLSENAFAQINQTVGSFNTLKTNAQFNTGLIKNNFNFEGRLSRITSEGYIDRAQSDLYSYFLTGGYYGAKTTLKVLLFGGQEETYQSWYGTPEARLNNDPAALQAVIDQGGEYGSPAQIDNLLSSDRKFNYYLYDNEIDHYEQDHYQLHLNHAFNDDLNLAISGHYTHGEGYFEQYRSKDAFTDYGLGNVTIGDSTITQTDLVRRRWLDNDFYGFTYAFNYNKDNLLMTLGGGYNTYKGSHFGEIIWSEYASTSAIRDRYYEGSSTKNDFNVFLKTNYQLSSKVNLFGDLQIRTIDYETEGTDDDLSNYQVGEKYTFFNPKFGLTYALNAHFQLYGSFAVAHREPVRTDFIDAPVGNIPSPEQLQNLELGFRGNLDKFHLETNVYLMDYTDQLILTGAVNDVGSSIRVNTPDSYRAGLEMVLGMNLTDQWDWGFNVALSRNKINKFTEVIFDYAFTDDRYIVENEFTKTDIAFSPNIVMGNDITFSHQGFSAQLLTKFVGNQFLDNTSNEDRMIESYFINDLRLAYQLQAFGMQKIEFTLLINNLLNVTYESNGFTWGFLYDGSLYQQNNYYPQAGINFLTGISLKF
jgi:iron complex outermembrane receptor protein